mgnify:CR=1 FL=1
MEIYGCNDVEKQEKALKQQIYCPLVKTRIYTGFFSKKLIELCIHWYNNYTIFDFLTL